jgi:hypothetical protein
MKHLKMIRSTTDGFIQHFFPYGNVAWEHYMVVGTLIGMSLFIVLY